jgi:hypothetical protein
MHVVPEDFIHLISFVEPTSAKQIDDDGDGDGGGVT